MPWNDIQRIRSESPLIHNITNYVVMNSTANGLLALGASPAMVHAIEEVAEFVAYARALVINIGTLSAPWVEAMEMAAGQAVRLNIPIIIDPVGCGATQFRMSTVRRLIDAGQPAVIRGNASEIRALVHANTASKGVDSLHTPDEVLNDAVTLARSIGCVISVSGPVDLVTDGTRIARIANGDPMMTRVTGMGCMSSAMTGAFAAVNADRFEAATHAMVTMGIAGEIAAQRVADQSQGPGSFQVHFLDALYALQATDIDQRIKLTRSDLD